MQLGFLEEVTGTRLKLKGQSGLELGWLHVARHDEVPSTPQGARRGLFAVALEPNGRIEARGERFGVSLAAKDADKRQLRKLVGRPWLAKRYYSYTSLELVLVRGVEGCDVIEGEKHVLATAWSTSVKAQQSHRTEGCSLR